MNTFERLMCIITFDKRYPTETAADSKSTLCSGASVELINRTFKGLELVQQPTA